MQRQNQPSVGLPPGQQVPAMSNGIPYAIPVQPAFAPLPAGFQGTYSKLYGSANSIFAAATPDAATPFDFSQPVLKFGHLPRKAQGKSGTHALREDQQGMQKNQRVTGHEEKRNPSTSVNERVSTEKESRPFVPPNTQQLRRTLVLGDIPSEINDFWIDKILRLSGKLACWRRVTNAEGEQTSYGFAEFESNEQFSRALEALQDFALPSLEEGKPSTKFTIFTEKENEQLYQEWKQNRYKNKQKETLALQQIHANLERISQDIGNKEVRTRIENAARQAREKSEQSLEESRKLEIPINSADLEGINPDLLPVIEEEIRSFRDRSALRKREKQRARDEYARLYREFKQQERREFRKKNEELQELLYKHRVSRLPRSVVESHLKYEASIPDTVSDEQVYAKERSKKEDLEIDAYYSRERRWLNREKARAAALEREAARERENRVAFTSLKSYMSEKLASFDDEEEAKVSHDEYFVDRAAWIRHRAVAKAREEDADAADRQEEEAHARHEPVDEREQPAYGATAVTSEMPEHGGFKMRLQPKKVTDQPTKREIGLPERMLLEEEDIDEQVEQHGAERPMLEENEAERAHRLRTLIEKIPAEREALWSYPVDWSKVTEDLLMDEMQKFVTKKIIEYIGIQEDSLITFTVEHIRQQKDARSLAEELEMALDEDAAEFASKVYRYLHVLLILRTGASQ
ncbi:U1 snRNP-associated protein Usp107 [Schizosaccharomyces cryophilus OY26]|uniref:U1 snRNP-associated protein Usp107 n=1 Tax=Schizosaccharomyces cryophilus (strain OY26 / ATCC MYA-4695 / CBS 11777 / NBRC 106824 / NRRL Y48691) TaxID=653667 RepID=S9VWE1_SCHCR|nr:U1 snRNP-associated protein Usp107 [Schizosaccharomyces cryophilus OY26]EPY50559.1 U1 snRNP-associated protein Usp107 [Schizosaccharomyces cryophilus OY26]